MAYVTGLIFADGALLDVRKSSRTCYIQITNNDKSLLKQVRRVMSSNHLITSRKPRAAVFRGKTYICKETFGLRIGNKIMFQDLTEKGLTPRKSLNMKFPIIPKRFFSFFLRGYFDGDGSLSVYVPKGRKVHRIRLIFVSGSCDFLDGLMGYLKVILKISLKNLYEQRRIFYLRYSKKDSLKILSFMYKNLEGAPYLERKYNIFHQIT